MGNNSLPLISIITVCYNAENTIGKTILSVVSQEYDNFEYIIIDGASKDNTLGIIQHYNNGKIKVYSEPDKGISDAFNKGIRKASGEVIGLLNADDCLCEGAINAISDTYRKTQADIIYGDTVAVDLDNDLTILKKASSPDNLKYEMAFIHQSCFISKGAYDVHGYYDINYCICMDYDLLARMYRRGARFSYTGCVISCFYYGGTSCKHPFRTINENLSIARKYGLSRKQAMLYILKVVTRNLIKIILEKLGLWSWLYKHVKKNSLIDLSTYGVANR